jgi:hypothetical protein
MSISSFKYYLVILDDFTHFIWTFPLRNKSDVHKIFIHFQQYVATHFFLPIRFIQCDNGKEFNNLANRNFFLQHGILLRFSSPYTSPQNGKDECSLRTINDTIHTLLIQASMPSTFWAEALRTTTYLLNIRPSSVNPKTTPFFSLFLSHPNYSELRVFDCLCFPNLYATSLNKLSPRSVPCVFLGYSNEHKGYRCLDLLSGHVDISRHVTFDESIFPFSTRSIPDSRHTPAPNPSFPTKFPFFTPINATQSPAPTPDHAAAPADHAAAAPNHPIFTAAADPPSPAMVMPTSAATACSPPSFAAVDSRQHTPTSASSAAPDDSPSPPPLAPPPHAVTILAPNNEHTMRTRAKSGFRLPARKLNLHVTTNISPLPKSYKSALLDPHWAAAMSDEFHALLSNNT